MLDSEFRLTKLLFRETQSQASKASLLYVLLGLDQNPVMAL